MSTEQCLKAWYWLLIPWLKFFTGNSHLEPSVRLCTWREREKRRREKVNHLYIEKRKWKKKYTKMLTNSSGQFLIVSKIPSLIIYYFILEKNYLTLNERRQTQNAIRHMTLHKGHSEKCLTMATKNTLGSDWG